MKRNSFIALLCAVFMIAGPTACQEVIEPTPDQTEQEENQNTEKPDDPEGEEEVNTGVVRSMAFVSVTPNNELEQATVQLASKGVTVSNGTYKGTGVFLNLVIRTETDEEGVVSIAEGEYAAADDTAEELTWQVTGTEGEAKTGSYVVAVIKDESTVIDLTEGTVTVSKGKNEEGVEEYTIVVKSGKYDLTYVGTLEGLYTPPIEAAFTGLGGWMDYSQYGMTMICADLYTEGCTVKSQSWQYTYEGNGYHLKLEIYCEGGVIAPGTYEAATELGEFKFNAGNANGGTELFEVVNGAAKSVGKITDGTIVVEQDGDVYTLTISSSVLNATYTGKLEELPKEIQTIKVNKNGLTLTKVDDTANNGTQDGPLSGVTLYYVELKDANDNIAAIFDFVVTEGSESIAGNYTVTAYPDEPGEAGNGYDYSIYDPTAIGGAIVYDNGVAYPINVGSTITVTENGDSYEITVNGTATMMDQTTYNVEATFSTGSEPVQEVTFTKFLNYTDYFAQYNTNLVGVELGTDGMIREPWTYGEYSGVNIKGTGHNLKLEFYSADGKLAPGTYVPAATQGTPAEGEFNFGYDVTQEFNGQTYSMVYGSSLVEYASDQQVSTTKITDGTITVSVVGDIYTIELKSSTINAKYVGKLSDGSGEEEFTGTTFTQFLNYTDYFAQYNTNLVGVELGTDGMIREPWTYGEYSGVNIKGTGHNLKLEFYSADGKLAPGTYVPAATQGTPAEGEFNFGYDVTQEFNGQTYSMVYGSSLVEYASDQQVSTTKITDGTITVAVEDDVYTIELNSSALNAKYVGKLSAE